MKDPDEQSSMSAQAPLLHTTAFPPTWRAQVLPQPPLILPARQFTFPQLVAGEEDALNRGALLINVWPAGSSSFLATCALGFAEPSLPTGLWSCPNPGDLLAIAGGYAYRIPTANPQQTEFLPLRPVCAVLPAPAEGLLLLAGFHAILALGPEGILWRTARLSWEGLTLDKVENGFLQGQGWDMFTDRDRPFRVDLRTGTHEGGGYTAR